MERGALMLAFDDPLWTELEGGYRVKYDPRNALRALEAGRTAEAWAELWQELHHQDDVGLASYAAVPHLVKIADPNLLDDWNLYVLIAVIEICRLKNDNPPMPEDWKPGYDAALARIGKIALGRIKDAGDKNLFAGLFAVAALSKGRHGLAAVALLDEDECREMLEETGWM